MIVTSKIAVDLTRLNIGAKVYAVQGDGNTRSVEITLLSGGKPWTPPEGVDVAVAYYQPDEHKGMYNKLADDSAAISVRGNVATVILAPQMLTVSGTVQASLVFNDAHLNRLTTFPFSVSVTPNHAAGAQKTEDYIRLQWLEDKLAEYLAEIKASGAFDGRPGRDGVDGKNGAPGRDGADGKAGAPCGRGAGALRRTGYRFQRNALSGPQRRDARLSQKQLTRQGQGYGLLRPGRARCPAAGLCQNPAGALRLPDQWVGFCPYGRVVRR